MEPGAFNFADCTLDLKRRQFLRNGEPATLEPRCYDVLTYLLANRDRVVTKDELLDEVWKTVVSETALTRCIMKLRRAVGDDPQNPSIIRTVHGNGYHIICNVSAVDEDGSAAARNRTIPEDLNRPSIAVLPFDNLSSEKDQEFFADGITEDIITSLSSWRWFPVISRQSTFFYKNKTRDAAAVGEDLGARYIVEGSVRRAGNRVRINASLTDTGTSHTLWADNFDGTLDDVFALQDEITTRIVSVVEPEISRAERQRIIRRRPENPDAWELAIRALAVMHSGEQGNLAEARDLLDQSIELDPTSSYAYSLLSLALFTEILNDWTDDPEAAGKHYLWAAEKAIELDGRDWLAHALHGLATMLAHRDSVRAMESGRTAVSLNPSAALAHQFLGCILGFAGEPVSAISHLNTTLRLNPRHERIYLLMADLSLCSLLAKDLDSAARYAQEALRANPSDVRARQRLVSALGHRGDAEAPDALRELLELQPGFSERYVEATYPFRLPEHREYFVEGLRKAGWSQ